MMTDGQFDKMLKRHERQTNVAISLIILSILLSMIALIGSLTKKDNDNEQALYCKLVHEDVQPDYNGSYQRNCHEGKSK